MEARGRHNLGVIGFESQTQLCHEATMWPLLSHIPSLDYSSVICNRRYRSVNVLKLPFLSMKTFQKTESRLFFLKYLFYCNRTQLYLLFYMPVKCAEKRPRIFQFTDVKTGAEGKVPSEVIQKINCDSETDERKSYCIPEARPPKESTKNKRRLALTQWKMSLPLSIFPFPTEKKNWREKVIFSISIHGSLAGMSVREGSEHREPFWHRAALQRDMLP